MSDKNCEILSEYLNSILYKSNAQTLDISMLDAPFVELGKGLKYLHQDILEMKAYSEALSKGNLSEPAPPKDNFLCESLKSIQSSLIRITEQLREREQSLKEEAFREKEHADIAENYNTLLQTLIQRSKGDILIISVKHPRILYASSNNFTVHQNQELLQLVLCQQSEFQLPDTKMVSDNSWVWETEDLAHHFYRITTSLITWQGEQAYGYVIFEITDEKHRQQNLEHRAYYDKLTQIGNRHYFDSKMQELLATDEMLALCYYDLDHLKYINDNYGHNEGDEYLLSFVKLIKNYIREEDVFARMGGDEFCVVLKNCPRHVALKKMRRAHKKFVFDSNRLYDKNFSFGIVQIPKNHGTVNIDAILHEADKLMYQNKQSHREAEIAAQKLAQ